jgi:signal transduction histidine kinase
LENCRRIVAPLAEAGGVKLSFDLDAALPPLYADETRLQQVVLNLLANAVKFTPHNGAVHVRASRAADGALEVSIADTGIGMTPEEIAIALLPFRQIDSSLSRRYEGTGLGLPLAKALTEIHGGHLHIESLAGKGTTVTIVLPATRFAREVA